MFSLRITHQDKNSHMPYKQKQKKKEREDEEIIHLCKKSIQYIQLQTALPSMHIMFEWYATNTIFHINITTSMSRLNVSNSIWKISTKRLAILSFFVVLRVLPSKCWNSTLKQAIHISFQILCNSLFTTILSLNVTYSEQLKHSLSKSMKNYKRPHNILMICDLYHSYTYQTSPVH